MDIRIRDREIIFDLKDIMAPISASDESKRKILKGILIILAINIPVIRAMVITTNGFLFTYGYGIFN